MKRIQSFCKLYKIQMPDETNANYYFDTLKRLKNFDWLDKAISDFEDLETKVESLSEYQYKAQNDIIAKIKEAEAFKLFNNAPLLNQPNGSLKMDNVTNSKDFVVEFDAIQANYSIIRSFAKDSLPPTWNEFATQNNIHPALINSKSFRQCVFGNINPSRTQKFQINETVKIRDSLINYKIVHLTPDAVSVEVKKEQLKEVLDTKILSTTLTFRPRIYTFEPNNYGFTRTTCDKEGNAQHKELFGVPGSMFYMAAKEVLLNEVPNLQDRTFQIENRKAYWDYELKAPENIKTTDNSVSLV